MGKYLPVITTAQCGSLTKAARILGYSQPSLSYIINTMEKELGVKLFHRSQRGVTLTSESKPLLDIMHQIEALELELLEQSLNQDHGTLRIGILPGVASQWLPGILASFCEAYPHAGVKLEYIQDPEEGARRTRDHSLDAFFSAAEAREDLDDFPLYDDPYFLMVSAADPLAERSTITLEEVVAEVALLPVDDSPEELGLPIQPAAEHSRIHFLPQGHALSISLVESGLGGAILPGLTAAELLPGRKIRVIPIEDVPPRTLRLFCADDRGDLADAFVTQVLDFVDSWQAPPLLQEA